MWIFLMSFFAAIFALHIFTRISRGITRSSTCLIGKTAIVTGANSGLGYQTALNLASRGCRVIMADVADMTESQLNIINHTKNSNIITKKLDLSSLESVRVFASDITKTEEELHILINNAGIPGSEENRTKDGLHPVMQINYFGHFLLTHLLIDLLKKSAPSRIVFTSSLLAFLNNLSLTNLNCDQFTSDLPIAIRALQAYSNSKLAMIIASDIFAEKLNGTDVISNCAHPGFVTTPIFSKSYSLVSSKFYEMILLFCHALFAKDAWEGSQTIVYAAVSEKVQNVTGKLFSDCKPFFKPLCAYNKKWCEDIWKASEEFVQLKPDERL